MVVEAQPVAVEAPLAHVMKRVALQQALVEASEGVRAGIKAAFHKTFEDTAEYTKTHAERRAWPRPSEPEASLDAVLQTRSRQPRERVCLLPPQISHGV